MLTTEVEAFAPIFAVSCFRCYIYASCFPVGLQTDHMALTCILTFKDPSPKITRWMLKLQDFQFVVDCRPSGELPHTGL